MWKYLLFIGPVVCTNCTPKTAGQTFGSNENLLEETKLHAEIAKDICACSNDIIAIYKTIENLEEDQKRIELAAIEKSIIEKSLESEMCVEQLMEEKYKGIIIDENLMESALKENCTDFYNMLKIGKM